MQSQDPDSQKNLMLAIALSLLVVVGWQFLYASPRLKDEQDRRTRAGQPQQGLPGQPPAKSGSPPQAGPVPPGGVVLPPGAAPRVAASASFVTRKDAIKASPRATLSTPNLAGSVNLRGGRIDDVTLVRYRQEVKPGSPNVVLFAPAGSEHAYFAEYGWSPAAGQTVAVPTKDTDWKAEGEATLTPRKPLALSWDNGQGVVFRRTIAVDDKFMFDIKDAVDNKSGADIALVPYARIFRLGTPKLTGYAVVHEGLIGSLGKERLKEINYADLAKEAETNQKEKRPAESIKSFPDTLGGWLGFTDMYWSAALIPPQDKPYLGRIMGFKQTDTVEEAHQTDYVLGAIVVPKGGSTEVVAQLFAGAKEAAAINAYFDKSKVQQFDFMVDWGYFFFITKPLLSFVEWLYALLGNFGVVILAVTVIVKGILFPLANKSYASMAKMKKLQPEMEKMRERFKDDRAAQQQEMMKLYQKEKINPASGCLPMLVQVPIFFALYKVLLLTIDMRHAPFFGWVKDLSVADPTSILNLFGLIPYTLPDFMHVGVWPILMGITMWIQMQLNPQQPDPVQQKIFNWMPVMFTFMLAAFPVGLVIYWAWSNILSLCQQYYIMHKHGADIHLWKNLGLDKWFGGGPPKE